MPMAFCKGIFRVRLCLTPRSSGPAGGRSSPSWSGFPQGGRAGPKHKHHEILSKKVVFCYCRIMNFLKKTGLVLGYLLGIYLILRACVEPFIINYDHPESYKKSWGGPTLIGVLAIHILPGVISLALMVWHQRKTRNQLLESRALFNFSCHFS